MRHKILHTIKRVALIVLGSFLMAFTVKTFIKAGGIVPAGFTGLTLLLQEVFSSNFNIKLPFSVLYYAFNIVPVIISFKFIGKKFTIFSLLVVILSGLFIDWMDWLPPKIIGFIQIHDTLLSAVFGGLLYAFAGSITLHAGATSGGTDFIAIFISEKYRKDAWNYIFAGNCVILAVAGFLFSLDKALYSIIFQFTTTMALGTLYRAYQQRTLFIITNKPDEVYEVIHERTNHGATSIQGFGYYEKKQRVLIYSVVTASEVKDLIPAIKQIDFAAFINVLKTEQLNGRFFQRPKD